MLEAVLENLPVEQAVAYRQVWSDARFVVVRPTALKLEHWSPLLNLLDFRRLAGLVLEDTECLNFFQRQHLPSLTRLDLNLQTALGVEWLSSLSRLTHLDLSFETWDVSFTWTDLPTLPNLEHLGFEASTFPPAGLLIARFPRLQSLSVPRVADCQGFQDLPLDRLKRLRFFSMDSGFLHLPAFMASGTCCLEDLFVAGCQFDPGHIRLESLRTLTLKHSHFQAAVDLRSCVGLESCTIHNIYRQSVMLPPGVRSLDLGDITLTDDFFSHRLIVNPEALCVLVLSCNLPFARAWAPHATLGAGFPNVTDLSVAVNHLPTPGDWASFVVKSACLPEHVRRLSLSVPARSVEPLLSLFGHVTTLGLNLQSGPDALGDVLLTLKDKMPELVRLQVSGLGMRPPQVVPSVLRARLELLTVGGEVWVPETSVEPESASLSCALNSVCNRGV